MFSQYILKEKTLKELQTDYDLSYTRVNQIVKMSLQKLNRYKRQRFFNYDNNDYISNKFNITSKFNITPRYTKEVDRDTGREITL